jgi:hypothetical protein
MKLIVIFIDFSTVLQDVPRKYDKRIACRERQ